MFKTFVTTLDNEAQAVFLQSFKTVPYFLGLLDGMLKSVNDRLGSLDPTDSKLPIEYTRLRAERDLLLEMVQVIKE